MSEVEAWYNDEMQRLQREHGVELRNALAEGRRPVTSRPTPNWILTPDATGTGTQITVITTC
ncbi:MAG: hypothetical protein HC828_07570 [Blastochloris sp.]|nr:hypothetical protein [Blastochloris sp.]